MISYVSHGMRSGVYKYFTSLFVCLCIPQLDYKNESIAYCLLICFKFKTVLSRIVAQMRIHFLTHLILILLLPNILSFSNRLGY